MNRHREKVNIDENEIRPYNTKTCAVASHNYNKFITNYFFLKATPTKKLWKSTVKYTRSKQPNYMLLNSSSNLGNINGMKSFYAIKAIAKAILLS